LYVQVNEKRKIFSKEQHYSRVVIVYASTFKGSKQLTAATQAAKRLFYFIYRLQ